MISINITQLLVKAYTEANIFLRSASVFRGGGLYDFGLPGLDCEWKQKDQSITREVVLLVSLPWKDPRRPGIISRNPRSLGFSRSMSVG